MKGGVYRMLTLVRNGRAMKGNSLLPFWGNAVTWEVLTDSSCLSWVSLPPQAWNSRARTDNRITGTFVLIYIYIILIFFQKYGRTHCFAGK